MGGSHALIPAAGRGERFRPDASSPIPSKLLAPLAGRPVLAHTLLAFERCPSIERILVVCAAADGERIAEVARSAGISKPVDRVEGGSTRQDSVFRGLCALPAGAEIVAIHDAARPLVSAELIERTIDAARRTGAALAAVPCVDTVKRVDSAGRAVATLPRSELRAAQTPQTFRVDLIRRAHDRARRDGIEATDDAALVERLGETVVCVEGDRRNLKITTPEDLAIAEHLLGSGPTAPAPRVGFGYDIHRLVAGRPLVLGGVEIPHPAGLDGHSDADVLLHALMDALLGAAGLPDIGHLFPNDDERWRGASSRRMLREVAARVRAAGWQPSNVDLTLLAERPKIAPHIARMRAGIAEDLGLPEGAIGVKATTNEGVGAVGREEAMAAHAVAMLAPGG